MQRLPLEGLTVSQSCLHKGDLGDRRLHIFFILFDFGMYIIYIFKVMKIFLKDLKPKTTGHNKHPYITGLL